MLPHGPIIDDEQYHGETVCGKTVKGSKAIYRSEEKY